MTVGSPNSIHPSILVCLLLLLLLFLCAVFLRRPLYYVVEFLLGFGKEKNLTTVKYSRSSVSRRKVLNPLHSHTSLLSNKSRFTSTLYLTLGLGECHCLYMSRFSRLNKDHSRWMFILIWQHKTKIYYSSAGSSRLKI